MKKTRFALILTAVLAFTCISLLIACAKPGDDDAADTLAPGEVSNVSALCGNEQIRLIWLDPADSDLSKIRIQNPIPHDPLK